MTWDDFKALIDSKLKDRRKDGSITLAFIEVRRIDAHKENIAIDFDKDGELFVY